MLKISVSWSVKLIELNQMDREQDFKCISRKSIACIVLLFQHSFHNLQMKFYIQFYVFSIKIRKMYSLASEF